MSLALHYCLSLAGEGRSTAFEPVMEVATAVVTVRISLEGRWVSPPLDPWTRRNYPV